MSPSNPLISVIVPVFNGARYLNAALDSVLQQPYRPMEIIVVDDGSTDSTADVLRECAQRADVPIRSAYQENQGPAAARNLGLNMARGEIIAFQDADDLWHPAKLDRQLRVLADHHDRDVAWGDTQVFHSRETHFREPSPEELSRPSPITVMQSMLMRRSVMERVGLFDSSLRRCEDEDWMLRARERGIRFMLHRDTVLYYRRHDKNLTRDRALMKRSYLGILKMSLERRRAEGCGHVGQLPCLDVPHRP